MKRSQTALCVMAAIGVLFGGCSVKKTPPVHFYYLSQSTPQIGISSPSGPKFDSMRITFSHASRVSESTSIYYIDKAFKEQPYSFSRWYDTVDTMFESKLLLALKKSATVKSVAGSGTAADTETVLEIAILDFVQDFSAGGPSRGKVVVLASLVRSKDGKSIATGLFEEHETAKTQNAEGGVAALNRAADRVVADIIAWLQSLEAQKS